MLSLEKRKAARKERKGSAQKEAEDFNYRNFLQNNRSGENEPGNDTSKGSTENSDGDATAQTASQREAAAIKREKQESEGGFGKQPTQPTQQNKSSKDK
ncbi:MAG TPA: hypothetical protein PK745_00060 [bacterium]|nr:hypothetical protein [bacterium]